MHLMCKVKYFFTHLWIYLDSIGISLGKTLEFKREIPRNKTKLLKTVVAFANGSGGIVCIGGCDVGSCENVSWV